MNIKWHLVIFYLFFAVYGSLFGIGEKTLRLNADSILKTAESRTGITELAFIRSKPVLALSSSANSGDIIDDFDLALSFSQGDSFLTDSAGNYSVTGSSSVTFADHRFARIGSGAALFSGLSSGRSAPLKIETKNSAALFSANKRMGDFSIEFWLNPFNLENSEEIVLWAANLQTVMNGEFQSINCSSLKNKLEWSFKNFFISPDGKNSVDLILRGISAVVPKTWSHHVIRFDSVTGMLEYLVNGKSEAIEYATNTRAEGGEVFLPVTGERGNFILGGSYSGLMDEFIIRKSFDNIVEIQKFPNRGGRLVTKAFDLGGGYGTVKKIDASGGRTSIKNAKINNEHRQDGRFRFSDDSEIQFFIRASNNPFRWDLPWQPVIPGSEIDTNIYGTYVQIAIDFYPSANGETSPYLEELRLVYIPDEPPLPPVQLTAIAMDGAVQLRWRNSPNQNAQGYLVYYGTSSDEYFGDAAALGISPIDAGKNNSITIDGLKNGVLYFFRVVAYSRRNPGDSVYMPQFHAGEFSREVRARPLQGMSAMH